MSILLFVIFACVVLAAAAFAVWPVLRGMGGGARALLAGAVALFVIGIGAGTYLAIGRPALAVRTLQGTDTREMNGVIALLARHMHKAPGDARGWTMLGRAYLTVGDDDEAAKAFERAIRVSRTPPGAELYSAYGEALVHAAGNAVPPQAEAAFGQALAIDPRDQAARYFLGFAFAARGQNARAIGLWQSLVDEAPANAPYRQELVDRIAALSAASGAAPDIAAMVAGLAARLKQNPNDPEGWQRLIRAYAVLGDRLKAATALADARAAMARKSDVLAALSAEARELKLEE